MPTYGYRCTSCGIEFERFQKMSEPPVTDCECGAQGTVKKLLYPVGIQFKGSGFYVNDYARSTNGGSSKSDSVEAKADTPAGAKTEAKSETKTESKAETSAPASASTDSKPAS